MKKRHNVQLIFFLLFSLFYSNYSNATIYTAISSGNWSTSSTWDKGSVPGAADTVNIDGFIVTLNSGTTTVKRVTVTNASGAGISQLIMDGGASLTITDDLVVTAEKINFDVEVQIKSTSTLNVGNVTFSRASDNTKDKMLRLYIINSGSLNIDGDFTFDYQNSHPSELIEEIYITDNAVLDITGSMYVYLRGGNDFDLRAQGSSQINVDGNLLIDVSGGGDCTFFINGGNQFLLTGDLTLNNSGGASNLFNSNNSSGSTTVSGNVALNSTTANKTVELQISGNNSPTITGNITINALSEGDVLVDLRGNSFLNLGGNFIRTDFGALDMQNASSLVFNGTVAQSIPSQDLPGSGTDDFYFTNLSFNNTSGAPIILESPITVNTDFKLTNGIIQTSATNTLTIVDGATISGGSETAYIDGPIIKQGTTNDLPFLFPTGAGTTYAPLEISKVTSPSSAYTVQYFSDPPPFGGNLSPNVNNISSRGYWSLDRPAGAEDVDITLHWMDAVAKGISNLDSLIVTGYDSTANLWKSYGNEITTGTGGLAVPGSVSSLMGDPPPWGIGFLTLGSVSPENALPIELIKFEAIQKGDYVPIYWQSASEIRFSHYVIERSEDGDNFKTLKTVMGQGSENSIQNYVDKDGTPYHGYNYYRLKMVDNDGTFEYSPVEVVNFKPTVASFNVFPNPVEKVLQIEGLKGMDEQGILEIFDTKGQQLYIGEIMLENGSFQISTDILNIHIPGMYVLKLTGTTGSQVMKLIKR